MTHKTLFINKAIDFLVTNKDGLYIDCTFGLGGHSKQILNRLSTNGRLIAIDNDLISQKFVKHLGISFDKRFSLINTNFSNLEVIAKQQNLFGKVSGIILDLGISTYQIKDYKRGFSFFINGPLDMRLNNTLGLTACDFLNHYKLKQILKIFKTYGDDGFLYRLTQQLCNRRNQFPFKMTLELSNLIKQIYFTKYHIKHKTLKTKTFKKHKKQQIKPKHMFINNKHKTINTKQIKQHKEINTTINNHTNKNINTGTKQPNYTHYNNLYNQLFKINNNKHTANNIKQCKINKHTNKSIHPATKIFQAIRSYINKEMQNLEIVIITSFKLLKQNTNLIIITFNSLESHLVKQVLKTSFNTIITLYPSIEEVIYNNSSRCSTMFLIKKL